ncbi:hypothetical protein H5410_003628 [Solanum commersonii]|uniref:DUF4283 domain-containing protein n=1 Tax=Solanum commersonii TaxID=4109 RepID=A0A9J6B657_SOLCO|nr:hypothetical protein H5410_003628 [Solanum commersonii]
MAKKVEKYIVKEQLRDQCVQIAYLHGEPYIIWEEEEVDQMIINENLQYAVIEEETSIAMAWISFLSLPPIFFGKEAVFSLVAVVEKPVQVDMATQNKTRPSCARVKVEVDMMGDFPK